MTSTLTVCKSCGNNFEGKYCNNCGEKVYTEKDKSLLHLFKEFFHFISHFEGNFFTTLKTVLFNPGQLSMDFCSGVRKKYFKPLSYFLLLIIFYLLFPYFQGLNMTLGAHISEGTHGRYALQATKKVMQEHHLTEAQIIQKFHEVSERVSKFLLFILIPAMAIFCSIVTFKKRRPLYDHFIFSIETNAFFLLWGFLILPLISLLTNQLTTWLFDQPSPLNGEIRVLFMIEVVFFIYVFSAARKFYHLNTFLSIIFSLTFIITHALFVQFVYKFILFYISIHLVH
ncbi:MAG: hypothetical protein JWN76_1709 [Chitinophagaceae bacterium]|nr:hypothetical protein [Chitinophagaceae bacterium]